VEVVPPPAPAPAPPLPAAVSAPAASLLSQAKMSEPLSLLSGLASNPMSISSIMKQDVPASFMPPNFNPAFPSPASFLPSNHSFAPGFSLQARLPMPPPSTATSQAAHTAQTNRSSRSPDASDSDSRDRSSSPSQMDVSTNVEPRTPARPISPPKGSKQIIPSATSQKPSALSSLLEFGTLPPSNLGDIRPNGASNNPFPFPFVNSGPGIPFSPQAAAGMATFYRPPFGMQSSSMPLDMSQATSNANKKKSNVTDVDETVSQSTPDESNSPAKKARKPNARSKTKSKKTVADVENGLTEANSLSSPPLPPLAAPTTNAPSSTKNKKKKMKSDSTDNGHANDDDEKKLMNGNSNTHAHNILAQMSLLNNSFMPPPPPPPPPTSLQSSVSTNGKTSPVTAQQAQQAQLAAMYNMAPHFAAYNPFPGAFNPAFAAAAYASGYPNPYGFHPAFGAPSAGQPFPFMTPNPSSTVPGMSKYDDTYSFIRRIHRLCVDVSFKFIEYR
jgi:hypothetical protein